MKKRIVALILSLIFVFSFSAMADGIPKDTKRELLRYILFTAQSNAKDEVSFTDVLLKTLMEYAQTDEEYEQLLRNLIRYVQGERILNINTITIHHRSIERR